MPELLLPASVAREIQKREWAEQRAEWAAKLEKFFDFNDPVCVSWNPHLKDLDPRLRLGRARPRGCEPGWHVLPGYYHWVRDNETTVPTVTPITGPDGESFAEPSSRVLEDLAMSDLHNPRVFFDLLARNAERERLVEAEKEAQREERRTEMYDRVMALTRTQVSMNDASPWTQNASGRREKRKRG